MQMKIKDFEKVKQLLEDKPNITEEEYFKRFWELWEETEEELAYIAPEDVEHWSNVYRRNVLYTVEDIMSENAIDIYPYEQGVDY